MNKDVETIAKVIEAELGIIPSRCLPERTISTDYIEYKGRIRPYVLAREISKALDDSRKSSQSRRFKRRWVVLTREVLHCGGLRVERRWFCGIRYFKKDSFL